MRVLVVGGAGFIGARVVRALASTGHEVVVFDNLLTGVDADVPAERNVEFFMLSVLQKEEWPPVSVGFDVVVHTAGPTQQDADPADALAFYPSSTYMLSKAFPNARIVYVSDAAEPETPSVLAKRLGEQVLASMHKHWVSLRLSTLYGPRQRVDCEGAHIADLLQAATDGYPFRVPKGTYYRDFLHVDDAAELVLQAVLQKEPPERIVYGVSGDAVQIAALPELVKALGCALNIEYSDKPLAGQADQRFGSTPAIARYAYRWTPKRDLADFLRSSL